MVNLESVIKSLFVATPLCRRVAGRCQNHYGAATIPIDSF